MKTSHLAVFAALAAAFAGPVAAAKAAGCPAGPSSFTAPVSAAINGTNLCTTPSELAYGSSKFSYIRSGKSITVARQNLTYRGYRPEVPGAAGSAESATSAADGFAATDTRRPAIIWIHGGSFIGGSPAQLEPYAKLFASYGFVSILPRYRFIPAADFTNTGAKTDLTADTVSQSVQRDIQTNVRHLRARATELGINPNAIYVVGVSSGGIAAIRMANRSQSPEADPGDRDFLVTAAGEQTSTPAFERQSSEPSNVNGVVAISAVECFPLHPNTMKFTFALAAVQAGNCHLDIDRAGDAPFWIFSGERDQTMNSGWVKATCAAYPNCRGATLYTRYNAPYYAGPSHGDGSFGPCTLNAPAASLTRGLWWVTGIDSFPGGDHALSDVDSCESRTGVKPTGAPAPGLFNNLNGAKQFKTIALNTYQALQPLAVATP